MKSCLFLLLSLLTVRSMRAASDQASRTAAKFSCPGWQAKFDRLTSAERELLKEYGVIWRRDWVISSDLLASCEQREGIEDYISAAMIGEVSSSQREFDRLNREPLFRVLKRIWPELGHCPAVPDDGAFDSEKWGIIAYSDLPTPQLAVLLRQSLRLEGLGGDFVYLVLNHPIPEIKGDIVRILKREENPSRRRDRTSGTQIYCLALLYSLGQKDVTDRLERLRASDRTTETERNVVSSILPKIKAGESIRWQDIEDIEWQQ